MYTTAVEASNRINISHNPSETPQPYLSGLPQGSPASPVLFLIYAQAMLEAPQLNMAENISYLDDDGLLQGSLDVPTSCRLLEDRMALRIERGAILNLPYDTQKSGLIHFSPQRSHENPSSDSSLSVTITNTTSTPPSTTTITPSPTIKHLGIHIDSRLTFIQHADHTCTKALQTLSALSRLRHYHRGITFVVARNLIITAVLPQLLWASPSWWCGSAWVLQKLERVYHRALRWATGLPSFTKLTRLQILARLPPLRLHLDFLSRRYAIRLLFAGPQHPLHKYFPLQDLTITNTWIENTKRRDKDTAQYPTLFYPLSLLHCFLSAEDVLEDRFSLGLSSSFSFTILPTVEDKSPAQQHADYLAHLPPHTLLIYTDGSKMDDGRCAAAWTFTTPALNTLQDTQSGSCYLGKKCEVYDAELHAISEALPLLLSAPGPPSKVVLCVDNQSALLALQEGNPENHQYARTALDYLSTLQQSGWTVTGI
jgi:hypothetical protein